MAEQVEVVVLTTPPPTTRPTWSRRRRPTSPMSPLRSVRRPENIGLRRQLHRRAQPGAGRVGLPALRRRRAPARRGRETAGADRRAPRRGRLRAQRPPVPDRPRRGWPEGHLTTVEADRILRSARGSAGFSWGPTSRSCRPSPSVARPWPGGTTRPRLATNLAQAYMFLDALAPGRGAVRYPRVLPGPAGRQQRGVRLLPSLRHPLRRPDPPRGTLGYARRPSGRSRPGTCG